MLLLSLIALVLTIVAEHGVTKRFVVTLGNIILLDGKIYHLVFIKVLCFYIEQQLLFNCISIYILDKSIT